MKKLTALVLLAILYACANPVEEIVKGGMAGIVSDKTTGEPVATVIVSLSPGGQSTVTGSDGSFSYPQLNVGEYTLTLSKEGYKSIERQVTVIEGLITDAHMLIERIPASLTCDKEILDFGENTSVTTLSFAIINSGYTDLAFKVETGNCKWLKVNPETDILAYGKTATIVATIDRSLLDNGENEAVIVVRSTSGGGNVEIKVKAIGEYRANSSVNTLDVSNITSTSASFNAEITNIGAPAYTERGFVYSLTTTPTLDNTERKLTAAITSSATYSVIINDLNPSQIIYVRAFCIQNDAVIYGNTVSFQTLGENSTVLTSAATNIGATTATLNADITDAGNPPYTERGFCYSTNYVPSVRDTKIRVSGSGEGEYSANITNLTYPTTYYVRAYMIQDGETIYGNTVSFQTLFSQSEVITSAVSNISYDEAQLNGVISTIGTPKYSHKGFCYSSTNYNPTLSNSKTVDYSITSGSFKKDITGLFGGTTYYVRAYVVQDGVTIYGKTVEFTTYSKPVVQTDAISNLTKVDFGGGFFYTWSVTFQGTVLSSGNPSYTQRGFVYGNTTEPVIGTGDSVAVSGNGTGVYKTTVTDLMDMKYYYVRAYVKTSSGYIYGNSVRFSTY